MLHGWENRAAVPTPSTLPGVPFPATMLLVHTRARGSTTVPKVGQADGQVQGVIGALPPAQKNPTGHTTPLAFVEPSGQPQPGAAAQGEQADAAGSHGAAP